MTDQMDLHPRLYRLATEDLPWPESIGDLSAAEEEIYNETQRDVDIASLNVSDMHSDDFMADYIQVPRWSDDEVAIGTPDRPMSATAVITCLPQPRNRAQLISSVVGGLLAMELRQRLLSDLEAVIVVDVRQKFTITLPLDNWSATARLAFVQRYTRER